jgi:hypothetical protein
MIHLVQSAAETQREHIRAAVAASYNLRQATHPR